MKISEITSVIKPKPPMNPEQARVHALKQTVQRSKDQLRLERDRQRQQRENERRRKQLASDRF